jgi:hypothetical protein
LLGAAAAVVAALAFEFDVFAFAFATFALFAVVLPAGTPQAVEMTATAATNKRGFKNLTGNLLMLNRTDRGPRAKNVSY